MNKRQFRPTVDGFGLESRVVMSTSAVRIPLWHGLPVLTTHTYNQVLSAVDSAFVAYSRSHGSNAALNLLTARLIVQANRLPFGNADLAPFIADALDGISPRTAGAFLHSVRDGLNLYIGSGLQNRDFVFLQSNDRHASDNAFPRNGHV